MSLNDHIKEVEVCGGLTLIQLTKEGKEALTLKSETKYRYRWAFRGWRPRRVLQRLCPIIRKWEDIE